VKTNNLYLVLILLAGSCSFINNKSNESTLIGTWRLNDIEQIKNTTESSESSFETMAGLKKIVKEGDLLSLFEDGSYSEMSKEEYKTGNWKFSDKQKTLSFIDTGLGIRQFSVNIENNINGKQIVTLLNKQRNVAMKFIKESESLKDFKNDPFYASNNLWRLKPKHSESLSQLNMRLANYFKHLALILNAAKNRKQDVVSFEFSQGPVKIYNGGIGIYPYNIIPDYWKDSFFDEAEATSAYLNYEKYLKTNTYKGVGIGNWIEDDYNILLSIYADFSEPE
jgi:hypothetical protein